MSSGATSTGTDSDSSATALVRRIAEGEITASEALEAYLARVDESEETIRAWDHLARDNARKQAEIADKARRQGAPVGALHGVPLGVKDIFDTFDMPTQYGTPLHQGRRPREDAFAVERLRSQGAIMLGKTSTTELATYAPGVTKTRNPHNPEHTPGGSSSGSAAAVAAGHVPAALGTQTNGSVIRPASFCGVWGYKPSFGAISRTGVLRQAPALDQVGVLAATLRDAGLVAQHMMVHDGRDSAMRPRAAPDLQAAADELPPVTPLMAFVKTPVWDQADSETQEAFGELAQALGEAVTEIALPDSFAHIHTMHKTVMEAEIARNYHRDYERGADQLSDSLRSQIERGREVKAIDYIRSIESIGALAAIADEILNDYDAFLTPAAPGTAPHGLENTGSATFCTIWTYLGMPALSIPLMTGSNGLPIGVQLVGARGDDARLFRMANWLVGAVSGG
ncbi:amidase [Rhodovibrio sodomensis]|uniref:Amidase n=1 Tax=Rhodovibrio sodomensis TaxID=1088 RepID=A0ABS1DGC5_9PROT|nr:amidase [Rhodovibrio sodomensis]